MAGKELTFKKYNLDIYDPDAVEGKYQMPIIRRCEVVPDKLIGFNEVLSSRCYN